ncbi:glycine zipper 2TM domain-containing protein [Tsuneonella amylolytica]|uniref:glycine zipper 2TM domain-containing protein n=1 Tax=Tsuneonella amylolytica TaxID=2338327 RepID=UPI001F36BF0F|nr:glycine zipper 2TM domain-containing protein [Tsuneonella amylolytica]
MKPIIALLAAATSFAALGACTTVGDNPYGYYDTGYYNQYGQYDYDRPDPRYGNYYANRYYRADPRYRSYTLGENDRIYAGDDGRYYCRRSDGSTGLVVGGVAGGVLGNVIAPGGSKTLGTILGAAAGAAAGASIQKGSTRCQ